MESVGFLPAPDDVHSSTILSLFGILSTNDSEEEEECHFCFEAVKKNEFFVMQTSCCKKLVHCNCFRTWASLSIPNGSDETVRCAYCRSPFSDKELCFLCLKTKTNNEQFAKTSCCRITLHAECVQNLKHIVSYLSNEFVLECGHCWCLWLNV